MSKTLVTAARGKTGFPTAMELRRHGEAVVAFVHRRDERSAELEAAGCEVLEGDLHDSQRVRAAVEGVDRAYFCYPPSEGLLQATATFAAAAKDTPLRFVVNMSQITCREAHPSPLTHAHWLAERLLDYAEHLRVVHVRPSFFVDNLFLMGAATIPDQGKVFLPLGEGKHAPISGRDQARAIAAILRDPEPHVGHTYTLTGAELVSMHEVASVAGEVLQREVAYVPMPAEQWIPLVTQVGLTPFQANHISIVGAEHAAGGFDRVTDHFARITGEAPTPLRDALRATAPDFGLRPQP